MGVLMSEKTVLLLFSFIAVMAFTGCMEEKNATGLLSVEVGGSPPPDYQQFSVGFSRIEVLPKDGNRWFVVSDADPVFIDLVSIEEPEQIVYSEILEGNYTKIRVTLHNTEAVLPNGIVKDVNTPPQEFTLEKGFSIKEAKLTTVTINLDVPEGLEEAEGYAVFTPELNEKDIQVETP